MKKQSLKKSSMHHQGNSKATFLNKQLWNTFTNQYHVFTPPLATYQRREKIELPKFDGNENVVLCG